MTTFRVLADDDKDTSDIEVNEIFMHRGRKWIKLGENKIAQLFDVDAIDQLIDKDKYH